MASRDWLYGARNAAGNPIIRKVREKMMIESKVCTLYIYYFRSSIYIVHGKATNR